MMPVLFSYGGFSLSSFGLFLALAFVVAIFTIWRIAKVYDLNEYKLLDLAIITFLGGFIFSRLYFVAINSHYFNSFEKVFLMNQYPGLSFWGGFWGGLAILWIFTLRTKFKIWQVLDFAAVGMAAGLVLGNVGCFLGGCGYGIASHLAIAVTVVGLIGNRLPVALFEAVGFLTLFFVLWKQMMRFHYDGKIAVSFLISLGIVKFIAEFYRGDIFPLVNWLVVGHLFAILVTISGIAMFYIRTKRSIFADFKAVRRFFVSEKMRKNLLSNGYKSWYNWKVALGFKMISIFQLLKKSPQLAKRRFNVKSTPSNIR